MLESSLAYKRFTIFRTQRYLSAHKAFESTLEGTEKENQAIEFCAKEVDRLARENKLGSFENPYTSIQPDVS